MQFNPRRVLLITAMLASASFGGQCLWASTAIVGTCPGSGTRYATIQSAVTASSPGTVIKICPGTYPEQVVINKTLTLLGIQSGNTDDPIITSPTGGVVQNATSLDPLAGTPAIAAQVLIQNANDVDISNIAVDGSNNAIGGCSPNLIGIYYQNASGDLSSVATRNQVLGMGLGGCQSGDGIFAQSGFGTGGEATVKIENGSVRTYQKNGITATGDETSITIRDSFVAGLGPSDVIAQNGIEVAGGATGSIMNNTVIDDIYTPATFAASGILIDASQRVLVIGNTVGSTQLGITTNTDPNFTTENNPKGLANHTIITFNHVLNTVDFDGIDACSNQNSIQGNTVFSSTESAIHLDGLCSSTASGSTGNSNIVRNNVINEACAGILNGGSQNSIGSNVFSNVAFTVLPGDTCAVPPVAGTSTSAFNLRNAAGRNLRPAPAR